MNAARALTFLILSKVCVRRHGEAGRLAGSRGLEHGDWDAPMRSTLHIYR